MPDAAGHRNTSPATSHFVYEVEHALQQVAHQRNMKERFPAQALLSGLGIAGTEQQDGKPGTDSKPGYGRYDLITRDGMKRVDLAVIVGVCLRI